LQLDFDLPAAGGHEARILTVRAQPPAHRRQRRRELGEHREVEHDQQTRRARPRGARHFGLEVRVRRHQRHRDAMRGHRPRKQRLLCGISLREQNLGLA
jgi:hypothetical protein